MMSKRVWILFGVWLAILPIRAATHTSPTAAYSDVAATIAAASAGDTVLIPAGSATWSSTLTISKSIYLIGAGTNSTHISGSVNFIYIALSSDAPIRISGIWFTMGSGSASCILFHCKCSAYRIDDCLFDHSNATGYGYGERCIYPMSGRLSGCIDHNYFYNWNIAISPQDDESTDGSGNPGNDSNYPWTRPYVPGTTNVCCIENNYFRMDANADAVDINEQIYHFDAPRSIIRYNIFDSTGSSTPAPDIDAHGNQSFWGGCQFCTGSLTDTSNDRSTVGGEIYCNTFKNAYYRFAYLRGGSWLIYSNTIAGSSELMLTEEEDWQTAFFNPLDTVWPAQDQITKTFIWNNTINGVLMTEPTLNMAQDATFIQEGRDYWMHAPVPTNAYYPYTPLVYPHPLVTGGGQAQAPPPPTNLHVVIAGGG